MSAPKLTQFDRAQRADRAFVAGKVLMVAAPRVEQRARGDVEAEERELDAEERVAFFEVAILQLTCRRKEVEDRVALATALFVCGEEGLAVARANGVEDVDGFGTDEPTIEPGGRISFEP